MSTENTEKAERKLSDRQGMLAAQAGEAYTRHQRSNHEAIKFYLEVGKLLREAKAACEHGEFGAVVKHSAIPRSTCTRAMKLAEYVGDDPEQIVHVSNFGIRMTLEMIKYAEKWKANPYAEETVAYIGGPFELMKLLALSSDELVDAAFDMEEDTRAEKKKRAKLCKESDPEKAERILQELETYGVVNGVIMILYCKLKYAIESGHSPYVVPEDARQAA